MTDDELRETLHDDRLEIWRLRCGSAVAGFVGLDRRVPGETEVAYFGLVPEFIGRGFGSLLLRWAINHVWTTPPPDPAPGETGRGRTPIEAPQGRTPGEATHGRAGRELTRRLWLHTCDYDHSAALAVYLRAGFEVFDEHLGLEAYPNDYVARAGARMV